jgi:hypothetical protein
MISVVNHILREKGSMKGFCSKTTAETARDHLHAAYSSHAIAARPATSAPSCAERPNGFPLLMIPPVPMHPFILYHDLFLYKTHFHDIII